jgi:hypothetical protein
MTMQGRLDAPLKPGTRGQCKFTLIDNDGVAEALAERAAITCNTAQEFLDT